LRQLADFLPVARRALSLLAREREPVLWVEHRTIGRSPARLIRFGR
jgi:hypothetical protein